MATLQKIRSKGVILIAIVGLALFAFIAEELVRAVSSTQNSQRQCIGTICGEDISYQEFNELYAEYESVIKMNNGGQNLNEAQTIQIREQVWNNLVQQKTLEQEAKKLGLTVTDAELQNIINTGNSPMLAQTPFRNQQTGQFDVNALKQFINQYNQAKSDPQFAGQMEYMEQMYTYWKFIEKQIRQQTLAQKYQALLAGCLSANSISAKAAFEARTNETSAILAAVPFTTIADKDIEVSDKELEAKLKEMKQQYPHQFEREQESRDIKYIVVNVTPSKDDEQNLTKELEEYAQNLTNETENVANIVRESRSLVTYNGVAVKRNSLPSDVANEIDSMAPGTQKGPYINAADQTMNVIKYIARISQPDSVEFRRIVVAGTDEKAKKTADSIMTALNAGAVMDSIAKTYNQSAEKNWLTSEQVANATMRDEDRNYIQSIFNAAAGAYVRTDATSGTIITQITDRRNVVEKYDVAIIKRSIDFSDETHNQIWNKFSSFLAANKTQEEIEANAQKEGYTVLTSQDVQSNSHYVANQPSTTEALRWIFNKDTKVGNVSELFECGNNNDALLVVMLTGIHKKGELTYDDNEQLKEFLKQQVITDKKAEKLMEQVANAKSIADVTKLKGAVTDTLSHVTFASPVFVQSTSASEPALSGAISAAANGKFVTGVRGNAAVYAFKVMDKTKVQGQNFEQKSEVESLANTYSRMANVNGVMQILRQDAKVNDNRYIFYQ